MTKRRSSPLPAFAAGRGLHATALAAATLALLAGCSGNGTDDEAPPPVAATTLSGTVAVGAPITNGTLRILDANGDVVASDVPIDADGRYAEVPLSGPAPYRIEACGHAGPNYLCVYSVAGEAGTAYVTPLTTATMLLASGQAPDALMSGTAPALTADSLAQAQGRLRDSLGSVLTSAGVDSGLDFVSGALTAGSRTGYDGVLDAVNVSLGQDAQPFVQITPRIGEGNLYLEQNTSVGTITSTGSAESLQLAGLETLFSDMSNAMASAQACSDANTGLGRSMATNARLNMGDGVAQGPAQVAQGLCGFFAGGNEDGAPMWGSRLLSPTLGRCDVSGAAPVCGVSFVLQSPEGDVMPVGGGMGVAQEAGAWKFMGDLLPISLYASAKAQRTLRFDGPSLVVQYDRALAFEVPALPGIGCARVSQRDASGAVVTVGYYKRHAGAEGQERLSLWTSDGMGNGASLDPLAGATRSGDDSWIGLPQGDAGDAAIRNFYRGGRTVSVSLYGNAACSTPFSVGGRSEFEVEVAGVPPVWAAMENLPWPDLTAEALASLRSLTIAAGAENSLTASWTFARGPLGMNGATVCSNRAECGQGGIGRLGESQLRPSARMATVALQNQGQAVGADDAKMLSLHGRNGEGVDLQSNYESGPATPAAENCH
jgi:hypothetical protein